MDHLRTWAYALLASTFAVLAPLRPLLLAGMFLVVADLATGVWAAKKRGERIHSAGLRRSFSKAVIYSLGLVVVFVAEKYLLDDLLGGVAVKLASGSIALIEVKSILENLSCVNGSPLFATLVQKLGSANDPKKKDANEGS